MGLGVLLLLGSPFLPWLHLVAGPIDLHVPGLFLRGGLLLILGMAGATVLLVRGRLPGLMLVLALAAAAVASWDLHRILTETETQLKRWEYYFRDVNSLLAKLNLPEVTLYDRTRGAWDYLDWGIWVALAGAAIMALAALLEAGLLSRGKRTIMSVLIGMPRCLKCRHAVGLDMAYCPGCGTRLASHRPCRRCQRPVPERYRFCPDCGSASDEV